jgi:L-malate glycosyltransferase
MVVDKCVTPIRVLFLIDSIWGAGGAEVSLLRLVQQLPPEGYQCHVVTFHSDELADSFIARFPCPVEVWQMSSLHHPTTLGLLRRLRRLVRAQRFHIVHTFFPASDLLFGPIAKLSGARVLISSRRDLGIVRKRWHGGAYRLLHRLYDQVHAVSESVRRYAIDSDGLDPERVLTIHNGVDAKMSPQPAESEVLRRELGCTSGHPIVTMVANVRHVKGIDVFLEAAALVKQSFPDAMFLIAGVFGTNAEHVAYKNEVLQLRMTLNLKEQVRFLGPFTRVSALLGMSDVFVLPSRSEGFSNALLEAMVCGVPPVATRVGGNSEVVEDCVNGFLVPPGDPGAIARRVVTLIGDADLRHRLGAAARARVLGQFTIAAMADRVMAAYDSLLSHAAPVPERRAEALPALIDQ